MVEQGDQYIYQSIINTFTIQLFVDTAGNDITGNGNKSNLYKTINSAVAAIPATGGAIIIGAGTYTINTNDNLTSTFSRGFLTDYNKPISFFFGTPNSTILESNPLSTRDAHVWGCQNVNTKSYGIIFHNMVGNRTLTYSTALFSSSNSSSIPANLWTSYGTLYNYAFKSINSSNILAPASLYYDNTISSIVHLNNCSFQASTWNVSWSLSPLNTQVNTAANISYQLDAIQTNTNNHVTFDINWHIITGGSDTTNGVYSGINAWL